MSTFLNASPVFGPVRSRRLGLSLGVNMMPASGKICTFDCIYCENGFNAERPCREPYNSSATVLNALEAKLREMASTGGIPDVITFAGNGEPTAAPEFPQAIAGAVRLRDELAPTAKIAVLSNGTRADRPDVHGALMMVDDNILTLDTVDPAFIPTTSSTRSRRSRALTGTSSSRRCSSPVSTGAVASTTRATSTSGPGSPPSSASARRKRPSTPSPARRQPQVLRKPRPKCSTPSLHACRPSASPAR